jgi:hypothetical protein
MNVAKIHISEDELQLLQNADWVLTKNKIIQKVYVLFGMIAEPMQQKLQTQKLPEEILQSTPKISRGENYNGLPYVMLDFPRVFSRENIFAIRSFFWWGNYFSITLHLKGEYLRMFVDVIQKNTDLLSINHFLIAIADDEWKHEVDEHAYVVIDGTNVHIIEQIFQQKKFLKISAKISFTEWNESAKRFVKLFEVLLQALSDDRQPIIKE